MKKIINGINGLYLTPTGSIGGSMPIEYIMAGS